jgi:hypothetical protein
MKSSERPVGNRLTETDKFATETEVICSIAQPTLNGKRQPLPSTAEKLI